MVRFTKDADPRGVRIGRVRIVIAPAGEPPFRVDAEAVEEDTFLVLSADAETDDHGVHPLRVLQAAHEAEPVPPGSVIARAGPPLRLLAVVHDLGRDPSWREEWVGAALAGLLREARVRRLRALAVPVLGSRHGRLPSTRFAALLRSALENDAPSGLARLWLQASHGVEDMVAVLRSGDGGGGELRRGPWPGSG